MELWVFLFHSLGQKPRPEKKVIVDRLAHISSVRNMAGFWPAEPNIPPVGEGKSEKQNANLV